MTEKIDDTELAKQDIMGRPEVSPGEVQAAKKKPKALPPEPSAAAEISAEDEDRARRTGILLEEQLGEAYKKATGEELTEAQVKSLAEISFLLVSGVRRLPAGRTLTIVLGGLCMAIPFLPPLFRFFTAKKSEERKDGSVT